jgi:transposase
MGSPPTGAPACAPYLDSQRDWLTAERLPAYAPDLNPVEPLWANLKGVELANLAADTLDDVIAAAERGIQRIRDTHHLAFSLLRHCGLSLW